MSDPDDKAENFLERWSRRKRAAETRSPDRPEPPGREPTDADANAPSRAAARNADGLPAFDPATLPPIESITATSDIRAFLAPGVPEHLARAALRRVWVTDPTIRDFIGLAENLWDFTKPDSVAGFGSLELTPELRRMIAGLIGDAAGQTTPQQHVAAERAEQIAEKSGEPPRPTSASAADAYDAIAERSPARADLITSADAAANPVQVFPQSSNNDVAVQRGVGETSGSPWCAHRKHGGAVPK